MSIELCLIVKNSGDKIINTLLSWKPIIEHWTILDTGSTDDTVQTIKNTLSDVPGQLFEEPNSNFKFDCFGDIDAQKKIIEQFGELPFDFAKARNRSLELCKRECDFIITIDDTYIIKEPLLLKKKLTNVVDKNYNAFMIDIENNSIHKNITKKETTIQSLRIIRSKCNYRWVNPIHELIDVKDDTAINVSLKKDTYIYDEVDDYHNKRSNERHKRDIHVLSICYDNTEELSLKSRYAYYAAQTSIILDDIKLSELWLKRRIDLSKSVNTDMYHVYNQYARLTNQEQYAKQAIGMFPEKLEAYYEAAQINYNNGFYIPAYAYLRTGWIMVNTDEVMFHTTYTDFLRLLIKMTLQYGHSKDAISFIHRALQIIPNDEHIIKCVNVCKSLNIWEEPKISEKKELPGQEIVINTNTMKKVVFITGPVSTGPWDGSSTDVRGSETSLIKIANQLAKTYEVLVFCETPYKDSKVIDSVTWSHLNNMIDYMNKNPIDHMICSRSIQYLKLMNQYTKTVRNHYVWFHDSGIGNEALCPSRAAFRKFIFLTNSHKKGFIDQFSLPGQLCQIIPNGIDVDYILSLELSKKVKHNFIYSSDANRGLFELLQMFPTIRQKWPDATLDLYCNLDKTDAVCFSGEYKDQCESNLVKIRSIVNESSYITLHGRVSKEKLYQGFSKAEFWFYPNTFVETFCITALEAQYFKCKILCPNLGALPEVVKSGVVYDINIDHKHVLEKMFNKKTDWKLEEGYQWALKHSYSNIVNQWIDMFKKSQ